MQPSSQPAMPHQQAMQLPRRSTGRGLLARPTSEEATPATGPTYPDRGRPQTRDRASEADRPVTQDGDVG